MTNMFKKDIYLMEAPFVYDPEIKTYVDITDILKNRKVISLIENDNILTHLHKKVNVYICKPTGFTNYDYLNVSKDFDAIIIDRRIGKSNLLPINIGAIHHITTLNPDMIFIYILDNIDINISLEDYINKQKSFMQKFNSRVSKILEKIGLK